MTSLRKKPLYQVIDGIRLPAMFSPKCFREALDYKPTAEDVFIVTYPKCGTTWTQNIVLLIFRKGKPLDHPKDFFVASPSIDMLGLDGVSRMPRPGAIKSHLPYTHLPYSPKSKYIFVVRNPRDTCVSFYHHTRTLPGLGYADGDFDDFFELFVKGEVEYNDYCDHLLSWYPHRHDKNVFYTTYEEMKRDTKSIVHKLANFLGEEYVSTIEKDNAVVENILKYSGFQYMKESLGGLYDSDTLRDRILKDSDNTPEGIQHLTEYTWSLELPEGLPKMEFVRKGIVGDWKNHFSDDQVERLNLKCRESFRGTDIRTLWST